MGAGSSSRIPTHVNHSVPWCGAEFDGGFGDALTAAIWQRYVQTPSPESPPIPRGSAWMFIECGDEIALASKHLVVSLID